MTRTKEEARIKQAKQDGYLVSFATNYRKAWAFWFDDCEARNVPFIAIRERRSKQEVELRLPPGTTLDKEQRARIAALGMQPQSALWFYAWDLDAADAERIARALVTLVSA